MWKSVILYPHCLYKHDSTSSLILTYIRYPLLQSPTKKLHINLEANFISNLIHKSVENTLCDPMRFKVMNEILHKLNF